MTRQFVLVVAALVLAACRNGEPPAPATVASVSKTPGKIASVQPTSEGQYASEIKAEDFAARLKKLSSDQFEGRKPGTLGERVTTAYIKDQFERAGLKPGNEGSWFQTVPMVSTSLLDPESIRLDIKGSAGSTQFGLGTDAVIGTLNGSIDVSLKDSPIVFAGYGVTSPDWDDYAGIDVTGKTVIVLVNDPGSGNHDADLFKGPALTYFGRWTYKFEEAARHGAAALFIVHEPASAGYPWSVVESGWSGPRFSLPANEDKAPRLQTAGWLSEQAAAKLFTSVGADFAALKQSADVRGFRASALDARLSVEFHSKVETTSSENVIGVVPGSQRAEEAIVYTAHWDHLGTDAALAGDSIYNGAIDNATGVAGLIEIAEAFAHQTTPPQRSVVFAAVTLEESGLLGSQYLVSHSPWALDRIAANINIDALPIAGPSRDVTVIGFGQSALDDYVINAAKAQARTVLADDEPEKGFFFRSDHLNFARAGIPALYAMSGHDLVDGGIAAGRQASADYIVNRYHKPADNFDPDWDYRGVIADLELMFAIGRQLADESAFPSWKPGADFARPSMPVDKKGAGR